MHRIFSIGLYGAFESVTVLWRLRNCRYIIIIILQLLEPGGTVRSSLLIQFWQNQLRSFGTPRGRRSSFSHKRPADYITVDCNHTSCDLWRRKEHQAETTKIQCKLSSTKPNYFSVFSLTSFLVHFLIHLSSHLYHHHHSWHPLLLRSFTPGSKPTFQWFLPTLVDFWCHLDHLHGSFDWTGLTTLIGLFLVLFLFKFCLIPHSRLSCWLPVSFLLYITYTVSYCIL